MCTASERKDILHNNIQIKNLSWLWLALIIFIIDQLTKSLASYYFVHSNLVVFPVLDLVLAHNRGAAFSFLSNESGWQRWFFSGIAAAVSVVIIYWLYRLPRDEKIVAIALSLVLGGALGNLWDRMIFGYVTDFILFHIDHWSFPAFNIADSAITVGAMLLIFRTFFMKNAVEE